MSLSSDKPNNVAELRLLFRSLLNQHWTRAWILQELCLARNIAFFTEICIFYGKVLDQLQTQAGWIDEYHSEGWQPSVAHPNPHATAIELINRFLKIWTVRKSRRDERWRPLSLCSTIYQLGRDSNCSHHRDKVFAFLEMSANNADIKVDYDRDDVQIFWNVIEFADIKELDFEEIDCLREVLNLSWLRLVRSASLPVKQILLPVHLDCGTLTTKKIRQRQAFKRSPQDAARYNGWFHTNSTSAEKMVQIVIKHYDNQTYCVDELWYCLEEDGVDLFGNPLQQQETMHLLNETWASRWETVAVSPRLFLTLCLLADMDAKELEAFYDAFARAMKMQDQFYKKRKASKKYGMRLG